jgi:hypothetical protein
VSGAGASAVVCSGTGASTFVGGGTGDNSARAFQRFSNEATPTVATGRGAAAGGGARGSGGGGRVSANKLITAPSAGASTAATSARIGIALQRRHLIDCHDHD